MKFIGVLRDIGCLFYEIIDTKFGTKCGFKRMKIIFRNMQRYDELTNGVCNEMVLIRFDINGHVNINDHVENSFCYIIFKLKYGLILGKPWMKKNGVQYLHEPERLWIRFFKMKVANIFGKKTNEIGLHANIIIKILHAVKKMRRKNRVWKYLQPAWLISIKISM